MTFRLKYMHIDGNSTVKHDARQEMHSNHILLDFIFVALCEIQQGCRRALIKSVIKLTGMCPLEQPRVWKS